MNLLITNPNPITLVSWVVFRFLSCMGRSRPSWFRNPVQVNEKVHSMGLSSIDLGQPSGTNWWESPVDHYSWSLIGSNIPWLVEKRSRPNGRKGRVSKQQVKSSLSLPWTFLLAHSVWHLSNSTSFNPIFKGPTANIFDTWSDRSQYAYDMGDL